MRRTILLSLILVLLTAGLANCATITVRADGTGDYPTIQAAIDAAVNGDTVLLTPGTYTGYGNRDISFRGKAITVRSTDPNDPNIVAATIIDCQRLGRGFHFRSRENSSSVLDGVSIINGYVANSNGGGILCERSSPKVTNCIFRNNTGNPASGQAFGGGMSNYLYSSPKVTNCVFIGNSGGWGGGMANLIYSRPTVTNCVFIDNSAQHIGGGMFNTHNSHATVRNCTFIRNRSGSIAGGMWNSQSNVKITNCTFSGNSSRYEGGGIYIRESYPVLSNCILWGNRDRGGTGQSAQIYIEDGSPVVNYCSIKGWTGSLGGTGNIGNNPLLESDGYHLMLGSPCIDAGNPTGNYSGQTDIDGDPRMIGGRVDMGADEVIPNIAPVACIVGGDRTVEAGSDCHATVTLDGSCSSDMDSTEGTNDDINDFNWYEVDPCDPNFENFLGNGEIIDCNLSLGQHIIILEVIDTAEAFDVNEVTIIVEDTTPPDFNLSVTPTTLWPANHKMVLITPTWTVSDNCDESPEVSLIDITMDDEARGNGHTTDDIWIDPNDGSIYLRAERSGTGDGRVYTIIYQAVNDSGNVTIRSAAVTVPHDQR